MTDSKVRLCCDHLGDLNDGAARLMIDGAIDVAVQDLENRGHDDKPRKVTITLTLSKDGSSVVAVADAKTTLPPYRTFSTLGKLNYDGGRPAVLFNPDSSGNPDQESLPGMGRPGK